LKKLQDKFVSPAFYYLFCGVLRPRILEEELAEKKTTHKDRTAAVSRAQRITMRETSFLMGSRRK